jgi:membrane protein YqaA with SNARE-associated domain
MARSPTRPWRMNDHPALGSGGDARRCASRGRDDGEGVPCLNSCDAAFGTAAVDRVLRGTAVAAGLAIPLTLLEPAVAPLTAFLLTTVWVHGPASPFLPAAYEPVLIAFGRLYPPLLIALLGTAGDLYIEYLDYHLFRCLGGFGPYAALQRHPLFARAVAQFRRRPFLTVWCFAWSPLPDWMIRLIAPAANFPLPRYLLAMALGRLPRFWLLASLGAWWQPDPALLLCIAAASTTVLLGAVLWRRRFQRTAPKALSTPGGFHVAPAPRAGRGQRRLHPHSGRPSGDPDGPIRAGGPRRRAGPRAFWLGLRVSPRRPATDGAGVPRGGGRTAGRRQLLARVPRTTRLPPRRSVWPGCWIPSASGTPSW